MVDDSFLKGAVGVAAGVMVILPTLLWAIISQIFIITGEKLPSYLMYFELFPDSVFWILTILGMAISVTSIIQYWILEQI